MSQLSPTDQAFADLAHRAGGIENLLNDFFGFLHRCTDFYVEFDHEKDKTKGIERKYSMGFPKGAQEQMVLRSFHKYPMKDYNVETAPAVEHTPRKQIPIEPQINDKQNQPEFKHKPSSTPKPLFTESGKQIPIGNGGIGDNYYWTQTLNEITVYVDVPTGIKSKDVKCNIRSGSLQLIVQGNTVMEGNFEEPIKASESMWTLSKGTEGDSPQIVLTLDKSRETWWKHVLVGHPEIDTNKVI